MKHDDDRAKRREEAANKLSELTRRVPPGYSSRSWDRSRQFKDAVQKATRSLSVKTTTVFSIEEAVRDVERFYGGEVNA